METINRILNLNIPSAQSAFLWGPRKSGKTTYLKSRFPDSIVYDFLKTDLFFELSKNPALLREQLMAKDKGLFTSPVILDEVQKIPALLNEVHWLIENKGISFILCGSSARKLKRGKANLLGGRAWRFELFPLVSAELEDWDVLQVLNRGMIPAHYLDKHYKRSLKAYTQDYLKEEVFAEGLTRNIPAFSRFLDAMAYSHGEMTNYSNIARDCGVSSKTVKEYYQILIDTLMGRMIEPFRKKRGREIISKSGKFYLFDVGLAGALTGRNLTEERGWQFGKAFEHFILMELVAYNSYNELYFDINYWRTKTGIEVDFVLGGGEVAIEVKSTKRIDKKDLRPMSVFIDEFNPRLALLVCNEQQERMVGNIRIMPYKIFLKKLWAGEIIN